MVPLTGAAGRGCWQRGWKQSAAAGGGGGGLKFMSRSEPASGASFQNKTVSQSRWWRVASELHREQSRFLSTAPLLQVEKNFGMFGHSCSGCR